MVEGQKNSGQLFSSDFLVAVILFIFVITAIQVQHSSVVRKINNQEELLFRESLISRTDTLVMFQGYPEDWNISSIEVLGLSTGEPNRVNETKLQYFVQMDTSEAKRLLGLRGNSFYFSVENSTGQVISGGGMKYEKGNQGWGGADNIYTVKRNVFLGQQGKIAIMRLVVW